LVELKRRVVGQKEKRYCYFYLPKKFDFLSGSEGLANYGFRGIVAMRKKKKIYQKMLRSL